MAPHHRPAVRHLVVGDVVGVDAEPFGDPEPVDVLAFLEPGAAQVVAEEVVVDGDLRRHAEQPQQHAADEPGAVLAGGAVEQQGVAVGVGGQVEHQPVAVEAGADAVAEVLGDQVGSGYGVGVVLHQVGEHDELVVVGRDRDVHDLGTGQVGVRPLLDLVGPAQVDDRAQAH